MTNEELDDARVVEALRIWKASPELLTCATGRSVAQVAARLARENWQPPPKVDADTLAARAYLKGVWTPGDYEAIDRGVWDTSPDVEGFRAGLARARATAPNADDVAELVEAARNALSGHWSISSNVKRLRKALAKFADTRVLPDSGEKP